jgi:hypothetical protein
LTERGASEIRAERHLKAATSLFALCFLICSACNDTSVGTDKTGGRVETSSPKTVVRENPSTGNQGTQEHDFAACAGEFGYLRVWTEDNQIGQASSRQQTEKILDWFVHQAASFQGDPTSSRAFVDGMNHFESELIAYKRNSATLTTFMTEYVGPMKMRCFDVAASLFPDSQKCFHKLPGGDLEFLCN